jgi:hypothetical protein
VGNAVTSFSSPSYPLVASKIARRNRRGVAAVDTVPAGMPIAVKISSMYPSNRRHCSGVISRGQTAAHCSR